MDKLGNFFKELGSHYQKSLVFLLNFLLCFLFKTAECLENCVNCVWNCVTPILNPLEVQIKKTIKHVFPHYLKCYTCSKGGICKKWIKELRIFLIRGLASHNIALSKCEPEFDEKMEGQTLCGSKMKLLRVIFSPRIFFSLPVSLKMVALAPRPVPPYPHPTI